MTCQDEPGAVEDSIPTQFRGSGYRTPVTRNPGLLARMVTSAEEDLGTRASGWIWRGVWDAARLLPAASIPPLVTAAAEAASRFSNSGQLVENLAAVIGPHEAARALPTAYGSHLRAYLEAFRAADVDPLWLDERTTTRGFHHLDRALDRGRGVIALLAHHGSWDTAARWAESHGYHLGCVAEVLTPRAVFERFVKARERIGLEIIPFTGGSDMVGRLTTVLAENHLVGLLADRDLGGGGVDVEFFGRQARLPAGPAVLARRSGAAIIPITMLQRPGMRYELIVLPEVEVGRRGDDADRTQEGTRLRDDVQATARALEDLIRLDPLQWHAFQPVFTE